MASHIKENSNTPAAPEQGGLHTDVTVERIDLVIRGLQKVRKSILAGAGAKEAVEAA